MAVKLVLVYIRACSVVCSRPTTATKPAELVCSKPFCQKRHMFKIWRNFLTCFLNINSCATTIFRSTLSWKQKNLWYLWQHFTQLSCSSSLYCFWSFLTVESNNFELLTVELDGLIIECWINSCLTATPSNESNYFPNLFFGYQRLALALPT